MSGPQVTPDHGYVLDRHPAWNNVVIGAGFSGHGFKLAPVVGKLLCELVMDKTPSYDMSPFRIDRFNKSSKL
ncbi:Peroxisomal sarcosine oxidase [Mizuhopecten yessoensis]|uniref:Peroxisomal sarcosine oxidase n=1 Tax=Mizuhopecten yessoensis TaxID=6573 RepID=A0A210Q1S5_MIZYE|nr:Peroxisomal sarcosine oxidase [Mizuhopecten yessoensis]